MTKVIHIEQINREEWRQLVQTSTTGTWFQSPEAYDFFASLPELFVPFAYGIADFRLQIEDCELRGVCCGYVTVERNPLKQFFTRRAIILGGPCLADDATEEEAAVLMSAVVESVRCKEDNNKHYTLNIPPIYIETRNFNDYSRWRGAFAAAGFSYQPHLNFHIDTSSPETVEANLGKSRKRDIRTTIRE